MVLSLIYSLFLYNRIFFGSLQQLFIRYYCDCIRLEFIILSIFAILIIFFGLNPSLIFNFFILSLFKVSLINF